MIKKIKSTEEVFDFIYELNCGDLHTSYSRMNSKEIITFTDI